MGNDGNENRTENHRNENKVENDLTDRNELNMSATSDTIDKNRIGNYMNLLPISILMNSLLAQISSNPRFWLVASILPLFGGIDSSISITDALILFESLKSLYTDRILPDVRMVKARLKQFGASESLLQNLNFINHYRRLDLYNVSNTIITFSDRLHHDKSHDVFLGWVDPDSPEDPYPERMWDAFEDFLQGLVRQIQTQVEAEVFFENEEPLIFTFHQGRYGMAQDLYSRDLDFFAGLCLGQIIHVVQLGISREILVHEDGLLVPWQISSDSSLSSVISLATTLPSVSTNSPAVIDNLNELKTVLSILLRIYPGGFNLSTLKTKIRTMFNKTLSETVFGYTRLLDLLQAFPINTILRTTRLNGNRGYLLERKMEVVYEVIYCSSAVI